MTRITKLAMHGFKSFGKKTDILLGNSFNCILGPNGSGKSNVLDGLCFVLGKAGSKGLRAEKTSNLIYNGGKSKNPYKEGTVQIYFSNENNEFPIQEKELKLSRTVKSNGTSVYRINDQTVTRTQVLDVLNAARINPDGYNIILQGDIVKLVEMSSIERRGIIEEISGISVYEEKKNRALRELGKVEETLNEADIILAERKSYIKDLKKDRDQAQKFKDLDDKIKRNKVTSLTLRKNKKSKEHSNFDSKIKVEREKVSKLENKISQLKKQVDSKKEEVELINKQVEESGETTQVDMHKQLDQLKVNFALNKQKLENLNSEILKIQERKKQLSQDLDNYRNKSSGFIKKKEDLGKEILMKEKLISEIENKIKNFKENNKIDENIDKELEIIDSENEKKQESIESLRVEHQNMIREKDKLEFSLNSIDEKIDKVLEVEKENKDQIIILRELKQKFKQVTIELTSILNEESKISSELSTARSRLISKKEDFAKLNAKNSLILERRHANAAVKNIIDNKKNFPGVIGIVSDLGSVNQKFSVALEIAAGNKIRSIVTESDESASSCIRYLKEKRLGVAAFFPLNKLKPILIRSELRSLKGPGIFGLAIDLVDFQTKYDKVFQQVFGNTLVVENIPAARRLGIGKTRMVTLEGDIIEGSGVMIGGFRGRAVGGFKEKEVSKNLDSLSVDIADLEAVVSKLESEKESLNSRIESLRIQKSEFEGEIIKLEKSLHVDSEDIEASQELKQKISKEINEIESKLESGERSIRNITRDLTQLKIKKQEIRNKINELRNPAVLAELNSFEEKRQELKDELSNLKAEIKAQELQEESVMGPEIKNIERILKQQEKEEEEFKNEAEQLKNSISSEKKNLEFKEKKQKEFYNKFKDLFNKRQNISDEIGKIEGDIIQKEERIRSLETRVNSLSLEVARLNAEISGIDEELSQFKNVKPFKNKSEETIEKEIRDFENLINNIGSVNMRSLEIFDQAETEYLALQDKKTNLTKEREDVLIMINQIEDKKKELFSKTFRALENNFKGIFERLTTKSAKAELVLEDKNNPFNGGLEIKVKLSGNKFLDLRSLSGGEKTLTALAFLFAVQEYQPASFYCLDEVDAALDKRNSEKLASLVRSYSNNAQYRIISHNDAVISEADNLYGVSMAEDGISKVTSLKI